MQGAFTKTFRSGLQPVELAKRILREMDSGRTVGVDGSTWAPNRFIFTLGPEDHDRFLAAEAPIRSELAHEHGDLAAIAIERWHERIQDAFRGAAELRDRPMIDMYLQ